MVFEIGIFGDSKKQNRWCLLQIALGRVTFSIIKRATKIWRIAPSGPWRDGNWQPDRHFQGGPGIFSTLIAPHFHGQVMAAGGWNSCGGSI